MKLHFISGLPRSGSTLLAAILRQNPRFHAGMTSPVSTVFKAVEGATGGRNESSVLISDQQRDLLLKNIPYGFYENADRPVVFDTSRMWCARLPVLKRLFPSGKIISCVREVPWIADSFERLYRSNGQKPSAIYNWDIQGTVWSRTMSLASSEGVIGYALDAFREACASDESSEKLMVVDYESLCKTPDVIINDVYEFIKEPHFNHDFKNVEYEAGEFDHALGADGLHTVRGAVEWRPRKTVLPPDLFRRFEKDSFWRS